MSIQNGQRLISGAQVLLLLLLFCLVVLLEVKLFDLKKAFTLRKINVGVLYERIQFYFLLTTIM